MNKLTQIIHSIPIDELTGAISVPIYQTATYVQEAPGINRGYEYARTNNPTRAALEKIITELEGGVAGFAFASGLAAIDSIVKTLKSGDEIVAVDDIYGGAYRLFTLIYQKFGIKIHYVDTTDASNISAFLNENTKLVWLESPTNPTLKISDIRAIAELAHKVGALVVVDNTFASPVAQNPIELGADVVMHSATKYLGGHSDLLAGLVVVNSEKLAEEIKFIQNSSGGVLGPQDCWLVIRGIETVALRVERQCENAAKVADFLASHPDVDHVNYPGLPSHKNHEIAKKQQNGLYGGMVSFSLKNDTEEAAVAFVTSTKYFVLAESLGGVKSLLCHPSQMTHKSVPREKRLASGINDSLIRLSCGIEHADDLISDLKQAFEKVRD
ncbi:MAG: PLP-dependent aspartate aminotransferase family protein [Lentimicrobiaceae bacterium]|jgi:cystathionine beta-lyase